MMNLEKLKTIKLTITLKFCLLIGVILIIVVGSFGGLWIAQRKKSLINQLIDQGRILAKTYAPLCERTLRAQDDLALVGYMENLSRQENLLYAMILKNNGVVRAHTEKKEWYKIYNDPQSINVIKADKFLPQSFYRKGVLCYDLSEPIWIGGQKVASLRVGISTAGISWRLEPLKGKILMLTIIILVGGIGAGYFFGQSWLRPFGKLPVFVEKVVRGEVKDLVYREDDEFGKIFGQIKRAVQQLRQEKDQMSRKLSRSNLRLVTSLRWAGESIKEGMVFVDEENKIVFLNTIAQDIFFPRRKDVDILGMHFLKAIKNVDLIELFQKSVKNPNQILEEKLSSIKRRTKVITVQSETELIGTLLLIEP